MATIFESKTYVDFSWDTLGDIHVGRPNLGEEVSVKVYRMFEYALFDVLCHELGQPQAQVIIRKAGYKAGLEFAKNALDLTLPIDAFLAVLANELLELKIGILRVESLDRDTGTFLVTIGEDLDCSGIPVTGEFVCNYDEGFISGVFEAYTKVPYDVREIDCWASGAKVCRFRGEPHKLRRNE